LNITEMNLSIRIKLILIFLGFLVLVSASAYATSVALESQAQNITLVDLAVHQRAEVTNIARAVIGMQFETRQNVYYLDLLELDQAVGNLGENLDVLIRGGKVVLRSSNEEINIARITDSQTITLLNQIESRWLAVKDSTEVLLTGGENFEKSRAITEIESQIPLLITQIDHLIELLQESASRNLTTLFTTQTIFFLGALVLLVSGYFLVRNNILVPITKLNNASRQIAAGNLEEPVMIKQRDEVGALATSFENMRREVAISREKAATWAEQLEERVEQRTNELAALLDISADLSSRLEVESVLRSVADTARELLVGKVSVLCLVNHDTKMLSVASTSGARHALERTQAPIHSNMLKDVVDRGKTVSHGACKECPILSETYLNEVMVAPLQINQQPIGALCVADVASNSLSQDTARVLTFLANSAANALENARLYESSQSAAALTERERIASEMHDGLAQTLSYLNLKTDQALGFIELEHADEAKAQLEMMQPAIQDAYNTLRQALVGLREDSIAQDRFGEELKISLQDFQEKSNVAASLEVDDSCLSEISKEEQIQLLRITQESLTNVRKHAEATAAEVSLTKNGEMITLSISDDGKGFDPANVVEDGTPHLCLKIMRGRVERVGGSLTIQSQPDHGTQIIVRVPTKEAVKK
jgi:two-component system nitrate/nitrite sensor histidine kinase NarX